VRISRKNLSMKLLSCSVSYFFTKQSFIIQQEPTRNLFQFSNYVHEQLWLKAPECSWRTLTLKKAKCKFYDTQIILTIRFWKSIQIRIIIQIHKSLVHFQEAEWPWTLGWSLVLLCQKFIGCGFETSNLRWANKFFSDKIHYWNLQNQQFRT
jgi:hypothetical protein